MDQNIWKSWNDHIADWQLQKIVTPGRAYSQKAAKQWLKNKTIDLLFIDGWHEYLEAGPLIIPPEDIQKYGIKGWLKNGRIIPPEEHQPVFDRGAKVDFDIWTPKICRGGVLILHDLHPDFPGVLKVWQEEIEFSKNYNPGLKLRQVIADINGDADNLGKIKQIETELLQPVATKSGLSIVKLNELLQTITTSQAELTVKQQELVNASQQISFQQLYEAVVQLQLADPDHCPACKTPIEQVTINPYTNASDELNKLQHLSALQQRIQQLNNIFNQTIINISQIVNSACARFSQNPLHGFVVATPTQANIAWWNSLHEKMADGFTPWQHIDSQVKQLEQSDLSIDQLSQQRVVKQQELVRLRGLADQIIRLQTQRQTIVQAIKSAENDIATFAIKNEKLIAEVKLEKATLVENMTISSAYSTFVSRLNAYRNCLLYTSPSPRDGLLSRMPSSA